MALRNCIQLPIEDLSEGEVMIDLSQRTVVVEKVTPEGGDYLIDALDERTQQMTFYIVHAGTTVRVLVP